MRRLVHKFRNSLTKLWGSEAARRHVLVGPAHLWKEKRDFQFQFLTRNGLKPDHFLLDFGCGTLRGGIPLIEYLDTGRYFGFDVRPDVLAIGRDELRDAGLEHKAPALFSGARLPSAIPAGHFDFVWAFSVLIHLSDPVLEESLADLRRVLKPDGRFYANFDPRPIADGAWREFPVSRRSLEFYQTAAGRAGLAARDIGPLTDFGYPENLQGAHQRMLEFRPR